MSLVVLALILAPIAIATVVGAALDERWELTDRIATTRPGRWARNLINQHIDKANP
jgi:hypothetical protein